MTPQDWTFEDFWAECQRRAALITDWSHAFERIRKGDLPAEFDGLIYPAHLVRADTMLAVNEAKRLYHAALRGDEVTR